MYLMGNQHRKESSALKHRVEDIGAKHRIIISSDGTMNLLCNSKDAMFANTTIVFYKRDEQFNCKFCCDVLCIKDMPIDTFCLKK
jgi:hypothetical protein